MKNKQAILEAKDTLRVLTNKIDVSKIEYRGWLEQEQAKKLKLSWQAKNENYFGRWQYFYYKDGKRLSLVRLNVGVYGLHFLRNGLRSMWEVYDLSPHKSLFEDVRRFATRKEAEEFICATLNGEL